MYREKCLGAKHHAGEKKKREKKKEKKKKKHFLHTHPTNLVC